MEKVDNEIKFWLQLGKNKNIGSATFSEILSKNHPISSILSMSEEKLLSIGLSKKIVSEIIKCHKYNPDNLLKELELRKVKVTRYIDDDYPIELREIYDPPPILYYKGKLNSTFKIGIVGSRRPTNYGETITEEIATFLAKNNICVVSGMAIGVDTIAHQATVNANGTTIAVLGCGLDQIYPSRNLILAKEIIEKGGAIISEFPIGTAPLKFHFPMRNRVISGFSKGIVITEAAEKSGSLITASCALEQNRDVFAVPGPIHNINSQGPNNLIRLGANIITKPSDILESYEIDIDLVKEKPTGDNETESTILSILESEPKHIDVITKESGFKQGKVSTALTMMELSGKIKHIGGMVYKINH